MEKKHRLLIISASPMWRDMNGQVQIFEPTLREIEAIQESIFDKVTWIGFESESSNRQDGRTTSHKIDPVLLPASGGKGFLSKIRQIALLPYYGWLIRKYALANNYIHTRGPSVPAIIGVVFSFLSSQKNYWHKYAGNWIQQNPPLSYRIQRSLLKRAKHAIVTVNGKWGGEGPHVKAFENPCVNDAMIQEGKLVAEAKDFEQPLELCFVGRIEKAKGVGFILEVLKQIGSENIVSQMDFIGGGAELDYWQEEARKVANIHVKFHGSLNLEHLTSLYKRCHGLLLPSVASEGFPKVIAEAGACGCLPIVSGISSITQYIRHQENGLVIEPLEPWKLVALLSTIKQQPVMAKGMAKSANEMASAFTFNRFTNKLKTEVFNLDQ